MNYSVESLRQMMSDVLAINRSCVRHREYHQIANELTCRSHILTGRGLVVLEDVKCRTATRAKTHEDDVSHLLLERAHNALPFDCDVCIVIVDRPTGDRSSEDRFLSHCLEDLQSGTEYVQHDKIALNEVTAPCLKPFVFFGSSSGDECWGINWQNPNEIITYHHHMGDEYETVGTNILEVWKADYALYDEIDE